MKTVKTVMLLITLFLIAGSGVTTPSNAFEPRTISASLAQDNVVITTTMDFLGDFVKQLGGDKVTVYSIISSGKDPHSYEPTPSDLQKLSDSDLILALGISEFDKWITEVLNNHPDFGEKTYYAVSNENELLEYDDLIKTENPHVWLSPEKAKTIVQNIATILIEKFDFDSEVEDNLNKYNEVLDALIKEINDLKPQFANVPVVEDHPAFKYLLDLLGAKRIGVIEEREGEEPSAARINEIIKKMNEENCKLIIVNYQQAKETTVQEIAKETGASIATLSTLFVENITSYKELIEYNLKALQSPTAPSQGSGFLMFSWQSLGAGIILSILVIKVLRVSKPIKQKGRSSK